MHLTTTPNVEGHQIVKYLGIVSAEVIFGANMAQDWFAKIRDSIGGRVAGYEHVFEDARKEALKRIEKAANELGANVVVNIRVDYETLGPENGMLMVAVTGTAVVVN